MFDGDLISEPDENSGPAILGREPVVLPDQRKEAARNLQERMEEFRDN